VEKRGKRLSEKGKGNLRIKVRLKSEEVRKPLRVDEVKSSKGRVEGRRTNAFFRRGRFAGESPEKGATKF